MLLQHHVLPLLDNIEESIKYQRSQSANHISSITLNGQYIANISIESLQEIALNEEEDVPILRSLRDMLRLMYDRYIVGGGGNILKRLFKFLKDFEIAPYLVNTKTAFMIYFFTCVSQCRPDDIQIDMPVAPAVLNQDLLSTKQANKRVTRVSIQQTLFTG
jgi:hypothetical protein